MITEEHASLPITDLIIQDAMVMLQVIRRLVKSGVIEDIELSPLALLRGKLVAAIQNVTGVNVDTNRSVVTPPATGIPPVASQPANTDGRTV